jgi:lysophospholipase L1-like esterase
MSSGVQARIGDQRLAFLRMGTVAVVLAASATAALFIPAGAKVMGFELERFKPWAPEDGIPIVRLFSDMRHQMPAFAEAGSAYRAPGNTDDLVEDLGAAVAGNIDGEDEPQERGTVAPPSTQEQEDEPDALPPALRIEPAEFEGIAVEIENPEALAPFFRALESTGRRQPHAMTRVAHYGDSSIATDLITHTVRRKLQRRFGDGGHGWLLISRGTMPYRHRDVVHRANGGWQLRQVVNAELRGGIYGYGGVQYRSRVGARAVFGTAERGPVGRAVSRFELYYRRHPQGGRIRYRVDGGEYQEIDTQGDHADAFETIQVPTGAHELEIRHGGGGPARLFGVVLETDGPGVVYDSLGLVGARARRLLNYDPRHISTQMGRRDPDLLVLGFGGNEADDSLRRMPVYEGEFVEVIRRMRAGRRDMACLVFAPLDQAERNSRGRVVTMPTVPLIVDAQRRAAEQEGCAFYDTFRAMGGHGAMNRWSRSRPRLALPDYRHATPAGYQVIGNMFYKALLKAFHNHLDQSQGS